MICNHWYPVNTNELNIRMMNEKTSDFKHKLQLSHRHEITKEDVSSRDDVTTNALGSVVVEIIYRRTARLAECELYA